jgi:hypothetical protein
MFLSTEYIKHDTHNTKSHHNVAWLLAENTPSGGPTSSRRHRNERITRISQRMPEEGTRRLARKLLTECAKQKWFLCTPTPHHREPLSNDLKVLGGQHGIPQAREACVKVFDPRAFIILFSHFIKLSQNK